MEKFQLHKAVLASDYEYALKLIDLKVDLNELDTDGNSPLHWAVFGGDITSVKMLLEAGADPNIISGDGVTPKWRARDFGLVDIDILLEKFSGKILTNAAFDSTSFAAFNTLIGQPLPQEDMDDEHKKPVKKVKKVVEILAIERLVCRSTYAPTGANFAALLYE